MYENQSQYDKVSMFNKNMEIICEIFYFYLFCNSVFSETKDFSISLNASVLPNGMMFVTNPMSSNSIYVQCRVGTGYQNCEGFEEGLAHFVEHMMLSGTQLEEFEVGAFTSLSHTYYEFKVPSHRLAEFLELLHYQLWYSKISSSVFENEKKVIRNEKKQNEYKRSFVTANYWLESSVLNKKSALGSFDFIQKVTADQIQHFKSAYYVPNNIDLYFEGNVDHELLKNYVATLFSDRTYQKVQSSPFCYKEAVFQKFEDIPQTEVAVALPLSSPEKTKDFLSDLVYTSYFLREILFQKLRIEKGLIYDTLIDTMLVGDRFFTTVICSSDTLDELLDTFSFTLKEASYFLTEDVLQKKNIRSVLNNISKCDGLFLMRTLGNKLSISDIQTIISSITLKDIQKAADRLACSKKSIVLLGKDALKPSVEKIETLFNKN